MMSLTLKVAIFTERERASEPPWYSVLKERREGAALFAARRLNLEYIGAETG